MHENQQKPTRRTAIIIFSLLLTISLLAISLPLQRAGAASSGGNLFHISHSIQW